MTQIHTRSKIQIHAALRLQVLAALALFALVTLSVPAAAAPNGASAASGADGANAVVNINTAKADQLTLLPRVGPSIAGRIVEYRDANGKFASPEDLMLVRGVGDKTFELLEPWIAVDGDTTLTTKVSTAEARERIADEPAGEQR